jgi:hypothetical protein
MSCSPVEEMRDALEKLFTVKLVHKATSCLAALVKNSLLEIVADEGNFVHTIVPLLLRFENIDFLTKMRMITTTQC